DDVDGADREQAAVPLLPAARALRAELPRPPPARAVRRRKADGLRQLEPRRDRARDCGGDRPRRRLSRRRDRRREARRRAPRGDAQLAAVARRLEQVLAHEAVELAVEDALGVADLLAGAMVLHPRRGMERVAADLRSPRDVLLLAALGGELLGAPSLLLLEQPRAQELHRGRLVLRLRALVLALDDDPARQMRDPDRRI